MTVFERLVALEQFGVKLGLDNIQTLLAALGHPEHAAPAIHVAGTNGKGSVAAMVERGLRAAGHRTGRYTSPHLDRIEERVAIDGAPIDTATFQAVAEHVLRTVDACRQSGVLRASPTFFEVSTAIAFEIFRRRAVDAAVVEVGLGGRFDATNVLVPAVSVIVSIDFDHERHLGATLESIAFEKAGIAKPGVPLIVGPVPPEIALVIAEAAGARGARMIDAFAGATRSVELHGGRVRLTLTTPGRDYPPLTLALAGRHQADNAVVAVRALEAWSDVVAHVSTDAIVTGLQHCEWPARLEWLRLTNGRCLLLDAAHNPAGARALALFLGDTGEAPLPIVMAVMQDKDLAGMVDALAPAALAFVATTVPVARAHAAGALGAEMARLATQVPVHVAPSPDDAVSLALGLHPRAAAAGSIFLVGPLRARVIGAGARRV